MELGIPDELDVNIQLRDWIFALEADVEATENALTRREKCWHSAFHCLSISAEGNREDVNQQKDNLGPKHPVQKVIVSYAFKHSFRWIKQICFYKNLVGFLG